MNPRMASQPINERLSEFEVPSRLSPRRLTGPHRPHRLPRRTVYGCGPSPAYVILLASERLFLRPLWYRFVFSRVVSGQGT